MDLRLLFLLSKLQLNLAGSLFPIPYSLVPAFHSTPSTFTITRFRLCPSNSA
jgi:hypothetical protein